MKVFIDTAFKKWILGAMIRESSYFTEQLVDIDYVRSSRASHPLNFLYRRYIKRLNIAENDLIVNHKFLQYLLDSRLIRQNDLPILRCLYTHESEEYLKSNSLINNLGKLKQVLVMNRFDARLLANLGIDKNKIRITYGAIDRNLFFPSDRYLPNRRVLITGDAKGRKNPEKIVEVINENPDIYFDICGRYWEDQLLRTIVLGNNYTIHEFSIEKTAQLMRSCSAFLTLSRMEGGPFPILEALCSGTPVVSTPVGWVPEIVNARNGVLVSQDCSIAEVSVALKKCFKLKEELWWKDLLKGKFTWEQLAQVLYEPSESFL
jgi:glycosyltransferase involved in cell wall biosynthesis